MCCCAWLSLAPNSTHPAPRLLPPAACSFWGQLVLTVVSTTILLFSTGVPLGAAATSGSVAAVRVNGSGALCLDSLPACPPARLPACLPVPLRHAARKHVLACTAYSHSVASLSVCLPSCLPAPLQLSFIDVATLFGILCGYISTFLAWSYTRAGRKLALLQARLRAISGLGYV